MRRSFTPEQDVLIAEEYAAGASPVQLAEKWGGTTHSVATAAERGGARIRAKGEACRLLTDEQERALKQRYEDGETGMSISRHMGLSWPTVYKILRKHGATIRDPSSAWRINHPVREDAFDSAETDPEAAYWVGFLMADGAVIKKGTSFSTALSLKRNDRDHIEKFRSFLGSAVKIVDESAPSGFGGEGTSRLAVGSRHIAMALSRYGVVANKTMTACVRVLEMNRHFWRGCVDGDGTLGVYSNTWGRVPVIGLCGAKPLMTQFSEFVRCIAPKCKASVTPTRSIWQVRAAGRQGVKVIRELYENHGVSLTRKQHRASVCLEWAPKHSFDWGTITNSLLAEMLAESGTWRAVANRLGVSEGSVHQWRRKHRL